MRSGSGALSTRGTNLTLDGRSRGGNQTKFTDALVNKVSFLKSLEPSHGVIQSLKKNFYSVLILHLLKPLFSVFHVFQSLSIFCFI